MRSSRCDGDDTVDAGLGIDVIIDSGGRDTYVYDAKEQGENNAAKFTVDGQEVRIEQGGTTQVEYLWDMEVLKLSGTAGRHLRYDRHDTAP